jgi:hypothetical protein
MTRVATFTAFVALLFAGAGGQAHAQDPATYSDAPSHQEPDKFDWLVVNTDVGFRSLRITRIDFDRAEDVPKFVPSTSYGVAPGASLGVRLWFVSLAAHTQVAFFNGPDSASMDNAFHLWTTDGELTFRAPLGRVQPYVLLGAGYSVMSGLSGTGPDRNRSVTARGANVRGGLGLDWFLGDIWTVGALASIDGLFLSSRAPVKRLATPEEVDTVGQASDRARQADGTVFGWSPSLALNVGLRI